METPPCLLKSGNSAWLFSMVPNLHLVWGAVAPSYPVCLQPQILATNSANTLTFPLFQSLFYTHTPRLDFHRTWHQGEVMHWMANDKFCSIFSLSKIWLSILVTHLIHSHWKLAMRLQLWNGLIFQSSAWYNCTRNNGKVICVALISEVHKQENKIVCLHWKHACFAAKARA